MTNLAQGSSMNQHQKRFLSNDDGRSWSVVPVQPCTRGGRIEVEGNPLVDYEQHGPATRIAEIALTRTGKPAGAADFYPDSTSFAGHDADSVAALNCVGHLSD